jgi:hypothetical protein
MSNWRAIIITTLLGCIMIGCAGASVAQDLEVSRKYKRELGITVNGLTGKGYVVSKKEPQYKISIKAPDQMDALLIQTCHREMLVEGAGREHTFTYIPAKGLEDVGSCTMRFSGVTKKRERITLGLVDFFSGQDLKASISCSGTVTATDGVSVCQAPVGLWQEISFDEEVKFIEPSGSCATEIKSDGKSVKYKMPASDCVILFKGSSGRYHKANWLGFDDYVLKE